jgi:hypothetical protein
MWKHCSFPLLTMGMLDEDEVLVLQKLQEIREKKAISLEESHNRLVQRSLTCRMSLHICRLRIND